MSWRQYADMAQDAIVNVLGERTADDVLSISYSPDGIAAPVAIRAVFLDAHAVDELDLEVQVSTVAPVVSTKIAELDAFAGGYPPADAARITVTRKQGDPLAVGTQTFSIDDHLPDGEGMVALVLIFES